MLEDRVAEVMAMLQGARSEQEAAAESAQRALQTCKAAQTEVGHMGAHTVITCYFYAHIGLLALYLGTV